MTEARVCANLNCKWTDPPLLDYVRVTGSDLIIYLCPPCAMKYDGIEPTEYGARQATKRSSLWAFIRRIFSCRKPKTYPIVPLKTIAEVDRYLHRQTD